MSLLNMKARRRLFREVREGEYFNFETCEEEGMAGMVVNAVNPQPINLTREQSPRQII